MESRRGARVDATFLVAIDGVDAEPTLREGDISATGIYFKTRRDVGGVGTIHWLHLVSVDRAKRLRIMAYVVRTVQLSDAGSERSGGVAFEFMPESDEAQAALHDFVRYVLAMRFESESDARIAPRLDANVGAPVHGGAAAERPATLRELSVRTMVLETSWAIQAGEKVRVDIVAPGMTRRIRLDGRAVRVVPKPGNARYDIEVEVQAETDRPLRTHSSMTFEAVRPEEIAAHRAARDPTPQSMAPPGEVSMVLDDLLSALILPPDQDAPRNRRDFLSGKLARVRLPTLLSLIEMERMTGRLVLRNDLDQAQIFIADGQIVDIEPLEPGETRRAKLADMVGWEEGTFQLHGEPVTRPNRFNLRTTAVLLDLARESDEARSRF